MNEQLYPDIGMPVDVSSYPWPQDFIEEGLKQGFSKRVPKSAIPDLERGVTRMVFRHGKAGVEVTAEGMTLRDLALELYTEHEAPERFNADDFDPDELCLIDAETGLNMLGLCALLREADRAKDLHRLEKKYGIEYYPRWIGFTYITGMEYVARAGETELPSDLRGKGITIVQDIYDTEEEQ